MKNIKFGTDGWRGVIAKDFTFENVELVAHSFARYLTRNKMGKVVIGFDARYMSDRFARRIADVLTSYKIKVLLSDKIIPTPFLSYGVVVNNADAGIMVTASHNPAEYNGIKFKSAKGGSVTKDVTNKVEENIQKLLSQKSNPKFKPNQKFLKMFSVSEEYINHLNKNLSLEIIEKKKFKVVFESMGGAGYGILERILNKTKILNVTNAYDPLFGGRHPEPLEENVKCSIKMLKENNADLGIITDGDADRIAFIDDKGNFINSQKILGFLLLHLMKNKKYDMGVGRTFAASSLLEKICEVNKLKLYTKPIGFKYVAELMEKNKVGFGGEESGGIGYLPHLLERDGIFIALLTLEMMAMEKKKLSKIIEEMNKEYGKYYYDRVDLRISDKKINNFRKKLPGLKPKTIAGLKVIRVDKIDGKKFIMDKNSWLLMRPSGTEPLVRVYAESSVKKKVKELLNSGVNMVLK